MKKIGISGLICGLAIVSVICGTGVAFGKGNSSETDSTKSERIVIIPELVNGAKYVINTGPCAIIEKHENMLEYRKYKVFNDPTRISILEGKARMAYLWKGDVVTMSDAGAMFSYVRTRAGFEGWVETENLTKLDE